MNIFKIVGCSLALVAQPHAGQARDQFKDKEAVTIDPSKSYIFYRTKVKGEIRFLRDTTPEQKSAFEAGRVKAYAKARAKYERQLARWQREWPEYSKLSAPERSLRTAPRKPALLTEETFFYPPPELNNFVVVSAGPQFSSNKPDYTYLIAVKPGVYTLYGPVAPSLGGAGTCLCMGSVKFEAVAGKIMDIGELRYPAVEAAAAKSTAGAGAGLASLVIDPPSPAMPIPPTLSQLPFVPADFRAAGKMPNYFGVQIDRLAPLPGVLAYQRDKVIDLKTPSGSAEAVSR